MKILVLIMVLLAIVALSDDPPTFIADHGQPDHFTGAKPQPLTFEQSQVKKELEANADAFTFSWDVKQVGKHPTGYVKKQSRDEIRTVRMGDGEKLKSWSLRNFNRALNPVLDQGNCGSCVPFAFTANIMDQYLVKGLFPPQISPQHYMDCSSGSKCNGAYGREIAQDAVDLGADGGIYQLSDYPYIAKTRACRSLPGKDKFAPIKRWQDLEPIHRTMLAALHKGHGISVGIAANGTFSSYRSGIYNGCNSFSTNHYVYIEGIDCETSVDKDGYCVFDENGMLPPGVGTARVRNSWGDWGDNGYVTMKLTDRRGRPCNNLAGERGDLQILDNGLPMPNPPVPVPGEEMSFDLWSQQVLLHVKVKEGYDPKIYRSSLEKALSSLAKKGIVK